MFICDNYSKNIKDKGKNHIFHRRFTLTQSRFQYFNADFIKLNQLNGIIVK